jgi:ABC-type transport system involved in multi-copper enzyme maturation permease subunit
MPQNWSRQLSEWNPQLWRELKARLKWRNLLAVTIVSMLGQWLLVSLFQRSWAVIVEDDRAVLRSNFQVLFGWELFLLMVLGSYLLVTDLAREEKRGTLAFLRLTPEPSQKILLGKVLGVPILLYWALALSLPLNLGLAIAGGMSPFLLLHYALFAGCAWGFAYTYALVEGVSFKKGKANPWYVVVGVLFVYCLLLGFWQGWLVFYESSDRVWLAAVTVLGLGSLAALDLCAWQTAVYRLRHPPQA